MSTVAWMLIGLGCLIIATRGPLLVAPEATLDLFRRMIETPARVRIFGLVTTALGVLIIVGLSAERGTWASLMSGLGWFIAIVSLGFLVLFPGVYKSLADLVLDNLDGAARGIGLLGVLAGIALVWVGVTLD